MCAPALGAVAIALVTSCQQDIGGIFAETTTDYRVARKKKPNFGWAEVARKKTPIFDVDGFPGGNKGAAGRHGGSARKKNPKNRRAKKTQNPF